MEKGITYVIIPLILIGFIFICLTKEHEKKDLVQSYNSQVIESSFATTQLTQSDVRVPDVLDDIRSRRIIKPFGIYITPKNSPVSPERFRGFHTGTDFEVSADEINSDVSIYALCDGDITLRSHINGYGGVTVQKCILPSFGVVHVIYGHMHLTTDVVVGDVVAQGSKIGTLGADKSRDADGERKHLHLSISKGDTVNFRGYVEQKEKLAQWVDPCILITCQSTVE